jgi:hypothetical protein
VVPCPPITDTSEGDGVRVAVASLIAVGVPVERADHVVAEITGRQECGAHGAEGAARGSRADPVDTPTGSASRAGEGESLPGCGVADDGDNAPVGQRCRVV